MSVTVTAYGRSVIPVYARPPFLSAIGAAAPPSSADSLSTLLGYIPRVHAARAPAQAGDDAARSGSARDRARGAPAFCALLDLVVLSEDRVPSSTEPLRACGLATPASSTPRVQSLSLALRSAAAALESPLRLDSSAHALARAHSRLDLGVVRTLRSGADQVRVRAQRGAAAASAPRAWLTRAGADNLCLPSSPPLHLPRRARRHGRQHRPLAALVLGLAWRDRVQPSASIRPHALLIAQIAWNIAAQAEARKHVLTKLFGGRRYTACYALAATIFLLGLNRDALYQQALRHQPVSESLQYAEVKIVAAVLFAIGSTLVLTSMWQLGITGTFLGD